MGSYEHPACTAAVEQDKQGDLAPPLIPDPSLITCWCRRCRRGGRCDAMATMYAEYLEQMRYADAVAALTESDVVWLRAHGWSR